MSLYLHLEEGLEKSPHEPAVIVMSQSPDHLAELLPSCRDEDPETADCLSWSYTQLQHAALRVAAGLAAQGVRARRDDDDTRAEWRRVRGADVGCRDFEIGNDLP